MSQEIVEVERDLLYGRGVGVRFGGVVALDSVDFGVARGEVCGLIGPNGAGKTTLFDCLAGLRAPSSGSINFEGKDITARSSTWRARSGIRRTFQRQQTFGWLTVEDNLLVAMEWRGGGGGMVADLLGLPSRKRWEAQRRDRAAQVLELCGIDNLRLELASVLPIGRARMVEIARAIVDHPKVLLLDEPTSGLERADMDLLGNTIQNIRNEERCSIVLVEHDVEFVMGQCDRITVLNVGQVIADGTPEEVRNDPVVGAAYFG